MPMKNLILLINSIYWSTEKDWKMSSKYQVIYWLEFMTLLHFHEKITQRVVVFLTQLFLFGSNSSMVRTHIFKCEDVVCSMFEPRSLHIICNIPINWAKRTGILNTVINYWNVKYDFTHFFNKILCFYLFFTKCFYSYKYIM